MDREPMDTRLEVPEQPPKSPRAFVCPWCEMHALGAIQGVAYWDGLSRDKTEMEDVPIEYALVQCSECRKASVQLRGDYDSGEGFEDDSPTIAYPAPRRLSLDPPADSGSSFPVRFLHEEFPGVVPGVGVLPLACSAACPGSWPRGRGFGWP